MRSWLGRLDINLAKFMAGAIGALVLAELFVRIAYQPTLRPDEVAAQSPRYRPAVFARHVLQAEKRKIEIGNITYQINELGYRGPSFEPDKPTGRVRVIVYGGSSVFDTRVTMSWPERMERLLKSAGYTHLEVINAGIPGHASSDSLGRLLAEGYRFNPDYVILYNAWNDIKYFRSQKTLLRELRPWAPKDDPRFNYVNSIDRFLSHGSQLYVRLRSEIIKWRLGIGAEGRLQDRKLYDRYPTQGTEQFRIDVATFVDLARNIGAEPILVTQARLPTHSNEAEVKDLVRYDYVGLTHEALVGAFAQTDAIIDEVGRKKNVLVVHASQQMSGEVDLFEDHVHFTVAGSERIATIVARALKQRLDANGARTADALRGARGSNL